MNRLILTVLLVGLAAPCALSQDSKLSYDAPAIQSAGEAFKAGAAAAARGDLKTAHADFAKVVRLAPKVAAGHSALGAVMLGEGQIAEAIAELEQAHKLDPQDNAAATNLAIAYCRQGNWQKSIALFKALQSEGVTLQPDVLAVYARALDGAGDAVGAEKVLRAALDAAPKNASLHDNLGSVLAEQKRYADAEAEFGKAVELDGGTVAYQVHLGSLFLVETKMNDAIQYLSAAVALAPNDSQANLQLGKALQAAGQSEQAIEKLRRAHELDPQSVDATYHLGLALQNHGDTAESLPLLQHVADQRPEDSDVLINLGLALVQSGKAKEALPIYQRALHLSPNNAVLHQNLGVAYLQQSDLTGAIQQFKDGLLISPDSPQLHYDLGLALKLQDRIPEAIPEFERAGQLDPSLPDPPYTLGVLYMQTGKFEDSARELQVALALRPDNGDAWSILGSVYKQMNEPAKAIEAIRRAIQLLPAQPSPHITLAAILAQQGDVEGAKAERKIGADLSRVAVAHQRATFALESGKALRQRGQLAEALQQLQVAETADPKNAAIHREIAMVLQLQGKGADAALERSKADELDPGSKGDQ
jgi:protein O-GlcNAc transferase